MYLDNYKKEFFYKLDHSFTLTNNITLFFHFLIDYIIFKTQ